MNYENYNSSKDTSDYGSTDGVSYNYNNGIGGYIEKNLHKHTYMLCYYRWHLDLFADLFGQDVGGIKLHFDQRVFLRAIGRFQNVYGVYTRSYGKTFLEVLAMYLTAILYPGVQLAITAQTKQNALSILKDKHGELMNFFPGLSLEIVEAKFGINDPAVRFANGSKIDVLANSQTSKGNRRHRGNIEEAALVDTSIYQDAIEPIFDNPRIMYNSLGVILPYELNRQINFFTTSWYRSSSEYKRSLSMVDGMANGSGEFVFGSSFYLNAWYGRGANKAAVKKKKEDMNPIYFKMNYMSEWCGADKDQLVQIDMLQSRRVLDKAEFSGDPNGEYYIGVDVARSNSKQSCQTSITVIKIERAYTGRIAKAKVVYMETVMGSEKFSKQAAKIKHIQEKFNARVVVVDKNGLGVGLTDELMKYQEEAGVVYKPWATINTDDLAESGDAKRVLYVLAPQSDNSNIISTFINSVEGGELELLSATTFNDISIKDVENSSKEMLPYIHTDFLVTEVSNLKLVILSNNKLSVVPVVKTVGKDRYSSTAYALWYPYAFANNTNSDEDDGSLEQWMMAI